MFDTVERELPMTDAYRRLIEQLATVSPSPTSEDHRVPDNAE